MLFYRGLFGGTWKWRIGDGREGDWLSLLDDERVLFQISVTLTQLMVSDQTQLI